MEQTQGWPWWFFKICSITHKLREATLWIGRNQKSFVAVLSICRDIFERRFKMVDYNVETQERIYNHLSSLLVTNRIGQVWITFIHSDTPIAFTGPCWNATRDTIRSYWNGVWNSTRRQWQVRANNSDGTQMAFCANRIGTDEQWLTSTWHTVSKSTIDIFREVTSLQCWLGCRCSWHTYCVQHWKQHLRLQWVAICQVSQLETAYNSFSSV